MRKKAYTGALREPLPPTDTKLSLAGRTLKIAAVALPKMNTLLDHYSIPRDAEEKWFVLAFALATEHVPGFRQNKKAGSKPTKTTEDLILFIELHGAEEEGRSVQNEVRLLVKRRGRFYGRSEKALRQRYYLLKNPSTPESQRMQRLVALLMSDEKSCQGN